jgi:hypothetical protein
LPDRQPLSAVNHDPVDPRAAVDLSVAGAERDSVGTGQRPSRLPGADAPGDPRQRLDRDLGSVRPARVLDDDACTRGIRETTDVDVPERKPARRLACVREAKRLDGDGILDLGSEEVVRLGNLRSRVERRQRQRLGPRGVALREGGLDIRMREAVPVVEPCPRLEWWVEDEDVAGSPFA